MCPLLLGLLKIYTKRQVAEIMGGTNFPAPTTNFHDSPEIERDLLWYLICTFFPGHIGESNTIAVY